MEQTSAWSWLGVAAIVAFIFALLPIAVAFFFRPHKPNAGKEATYECGLHPQNNPHIQFHIQYYLYALVFLIFSIEILYIYPTALHFKQWGMTGLVEMGIFVAVLATGLAYAWKKGGLEWH